MNENLYSGTDRRWDKERQAIFMGQEITIASRVVRKADLLSSTVGDALVIVNIEMDRCFELDTVGAAIWTRLETPMTVEGLVHDLSTAFAGDPSQMSADVLTFLNQLAEQQLISLSPAERRAD